MNGLCMFQGELSEQRILKRLHVAIFNSLKTMKPT
jgi:hypothetical protein